MVQSTPLQISDKLFFVNGSNGLISINAITSKKIWEIKIPSPIGKRGFTGNKNSFMYQHLMVCMKFMAQQVNYHLYI